MCAVVAVIAGCGGGHGDDDQGPFAYDAKAPLDIREQGSWNSGDMTVHSITYASPKGGRVPALVLVPAGTRPFAGLIVQHGMPGPMGGLLAGVEDRVDAFVLRVGDGGLVEQDDVVPPADARRYQAAAPEPKEIEWYDGGHFLPHEADCDAAAWLARHIGTSPDTASR